MGAFWYHAVPPTITAVGLVSIMCLTHSRSTHLQARVSRACAWDTARFGNPKTVEFRSRQPLTCLYSCSAEPALVVAFWYHAISLIISAVGLVSGKPEFPVMPRPAAVAMMLAIGFESFLGQLCWARAFQIGNAARMSAITYVDVSSISACMRQR